MLSHNCMIIALLSWVGLSLLICLIICRAAARPIPSADTEPTPTVTASKAIPRSSPVADHLDVATVSVS